MSQPGAVDDVSQPPGSSQLIAVGNSQADSEGVARQRWKIAQLEEKLQVLESGQATKWRETNYYVSKGRAIRHIVTLYDAIEDLIAEHDRRWDSNESDENVTVE
ncbi:uncharacterized protein BJ212DRAFT_1477410 [Suillus subaureus]|uniref:Uncharacterized protein n=1 Tax=Suillus subaureus TaxID=48587 RepID=A0A9P7EGM8_9AGAM|nr:uncharacterized protein BJ212DRAFT_1477410 [Suillus subaureus]KAG1821538.1 hypothetical protein BJ212DRAFT_1477410 [Suillus subaureus]